MGNSNVTRLYYKYVNYYTSEDYICNMIGLYIALNKDKVKHLL